MAGIFFILQKIYLFLISWENFNIKEIEVVCAKEELKNQILKFYEGKHLGNIFLLDASALKNTLLNHRWVKEARVRKVFPHGIKIEIEERKPFALLMINSPCLIDKEGVYLEQCDFSQNSDFPILTDLNNFRENYKEKVKIAAKFFQSLAPSERQRVHSLDLSNTRNIILRFKNTQTMLLLGDDRFSEKIHIFEKLSGILKKYGDLEYVDLRFPDRLYIKPQKNPSDNLLASVGWEVK